jgi:hypothetical protein
MVTTPEQLAVLLRQGQQMERDSSRMLQPPQRGAMHWSQALGGVLGGVGGNYLQSSAAQQTGEGRMTGEKDLAAGMQGDREALARALQNPFVGDQARKYLATSQSQPQGQKMPWWVTQGENGQYGVHPAMKAYQSIKAPAFAPVVIDGALVSRSGPNAGQPLYQRPPTPSERIMENYATQPQPVPGGGGNNPNVRPQSAPGASPFAGGGVVTERGLTPVADTMQPNVTPVAQEQPQSQPADPGDALTQQQLDVLLTDPKTRPMAQAILDRRAAREAPYSFSKKTIQDLQTDTLAKQQLISDLYRIKDSFDPSFQKWGTKIWMDFLRQKDKSPLGLTSAEKKELAAFTEYRQNAYTNLNNYIKSITGAAMSIQEAQRITKGMPNPGDNFWEGDSPEETKTKIDNAVQGAELALARIRYLQKLGRMPKNADEAARAVSLGQMRNVIMKETRDRARAFMQQGLDQGQAIQQAEQLVRREYGI